MKSFPALILAATVALPTLAAAQESTNVPPTPTPSTDCSVSGGCPSTGTGSQPNTTPDSTLEGGSSGSTSGGSGTLDNTSPGSSVDPGDSSGSGGSNGSGGAAAGPLGNSTSD